MRHRLLTDPFFENRYLPEVPILLSAKHFSREEYARLSQYNGIYGWNFVNESGRLETAVLFELCSVRQVKYNSLFWLLGRYAL